MKYAIFNKRMQEYVMNFSEYVAPGSEERMTFSTENEAENWLKTMNFLNPEDYLIEKIA